MKMDWDSPFSPVFRLFAAENRVTTKRTKRTKLHEIEEAD